MSANNTTSGSSFTNFNRVLYTYFIHYCEAEGLTRYHEQSRKVLLYLFHGSFKSPSECDVPVIRAIHKNMQTVAYRWCGSHMRTIAYVYTQSATRTLTHRFDAGIEKCFKDAIDFFTENDDMKDLLTDKGTRKVSRKYLAAWEKGFRNAALSGQPIFTKKSIVSKQIWRNVELWRPRSCYIYVSRKCLSCPNYKRWNDFRWSDYLQRTEIMETFRIRHLPVLRGEVDIPSKYLPDPECWELDTTVESVHRDKKKSTKKKSPRRTPSQPVKRKMVWDFELEDWVPNEMGCQTPPKTPTTPVSSKGKKKSRKKRKRRVRSPSPSPCPSFSEDSLSGSESCTSLESFKGTLEETPRRKKR